MSEIQQVIEQARRAQQEHEQLHPVQLEIPDPEFAPCGAKWHGVREGSPDDGCGWGDLCPSRDNKDCDPGDCTDAT